MERRGRWLKDEHVCNRLVVLCSACAVRVMGEGGKGPLRKVSSARRLAAAMRPLECDRMPTSEQGPLSEVIQV